MKNQSIGIIIILGFLTSSSLCYALTPDEVVVVANKNGWHSIDLSRYYMLKRGIPQDNIIRLWTTDKETVSREYYERQIARPIKKFILKKQEQGKDIHCLVLMFGMPLRILPPELTKEEIKKYGSKPFSA